MIAEGGHITNWVILASRQVSLMKLDWIARGTMDGISYIHSDSTVQCSSVNSLELKQLLVLMHMVVLVL